MDVKLHATRYKIDTTVDICKALPVQQRSRLTLYKLEKFPDTSTFPSAPFRLNGQVLNSPV